MKKYFLLESSFDKYVSLKMRQYLTMIVNKIAVTVLINKYRFVINKSLVNSSNDDESYQIDLIDATNSEILLVNAANISINDANIVINVNTNPTSKVTQYESGNNVSISRYAFDSKQYAKLGYFYESSIDGINTSITSIIADLFTNIVKRFIIDTVNAISNLIKITNGLNTIIHDDGEYKVYLAILIDTDMFDSRFLAKCYKNVTRVDTTLRILDSEVDFEFIKSEINKCESYLISEVKRITSDYQDHVADFGGATIYVDGKKILCHSSFRPSVGNKFVTFKCPYTDRIECYNIEKCDNISIEHLDTVHGTEAFLIGHSL